MKKIFITSNLLGLFFALLLISSCSSEPQKPTVYVVEIKDMKFMPDNITVHKGDTVLWINRDMVAHDVTEETSKAWGSPLIPAGGSWKMEVNDAASYYCSIHVVMKGKLEVQ